MGRTESSVSNMIGSNVFDLLVAVLLGVMLTGAIVVNFTQIVPVTAFLVLARLRCWCSCFATWRCRCERPM